MVKKKKKRWSRKEGGLGRNQVSAESISNPGGELSPEQNGERSKWRGPWAAGTATAAPGVCSCTQKGKKCWNGIALGSAWQQPCPQLSPVLPRHCCLCTHRRVQTSDVTVKSFPGFVCLMKFYSRSLILKANKPIACPSCCQRRY